MRQTIIAKNDDLRDGFCLGIIVKILPGKSLSLDPVSALRNAAREFAETEEGQKALEETGGCFNWGDLVSCIPAEICERNGVRIIDTFQTELIVSHNEQLII